MVMPALFGGFGKKNYINLIFNSSRVYFNILSYKLLNNENSTIDLETILTFKDIESISSTIGQYNRAPEVCYYITQLSNLNFIHSQLGPYLLFNGSN